ncbi:MULTISPECIES: vitamin K epoxide reductase family protein [Mumia]|uniref:vitamin K epoxide reductase family protein n=1 Tax=Mumia TaxID=1546255 RepID=UPI00141E0853|nr:MULTISPECIES: vitamin K epoxide reductase family protein [unclassified Mumia]QMW67681.1 vitamin K epoxide reductase family protein [Mumia sp. ZJ1417]
MTATVLVDRTRRSGAAIWVVMLLSSIVSLVASFVLAVEAITLAENPSAELGCDINAVLSCGTVASSWQASVFGFPNAFLGLIAEPVVITIAVAALSGVRFKRWFMLAAQLFYTLGLALAYWLFYQAMFNIGALCPWCLLITVATTLVFFEMTRVNIRDNNLYLPPRIQQTLSSAVQWNLDVMVVIAWLLALVLLIVVKYGNALFS